MALSPLRFRNNQELHDFIIRLRQIPLEKIHTKFLQTNNEDFYLVEDVEAYLNNAADEDIQSSNIIFVSADNELVTLAQIKADSSYYNRLHHNYSSAGSLIYALNFNLLSAQDYPPLNTIEEVEQAQNVFQNKALYQSIRLENSLRAMNASSAFLLPLPGASFFQNPLPTNPFAYLSNLKKDILKITYIEELKLKAHLVNRTMNASDDGVKSNLEAWIKQINANHELTKTLLQTALDTYKKQLSTFQSAKGEYQRHMQEDPTLEKIQQKIKALESERIPLIDSLTWWTSVYNVLRPITVYGTMLVLPFVAIGLLFYLTLSFAPALATSALIVLGAMSMFLFFDNSIIEKLTIIEYSIGSIFSLNHIQEKIDDNSLQSQAVSKKLHSIEQFSEMENKELFDEQYVVFIETLEEDLKELAVLEGVQSSPAPQEPSLSETSVTNVSIFRKERPVGKQQDGEALSCGYGLAP